jgi:hypothetical protein
MELKITSLILTCPQFVTSQTGQEDSEEIARILARMMESWKGKQGALIA